MSSEIIYHQTVMRLPKTVSAMPHDLYFWLWQIGSSNCYEVDHNRPGSVGRRARAWSMASFGRREQVMRTAVYFAGDCEGGMLKLRSATTGCDPETLIRSVRRMLGEADKASDLPETTSSGAAQASNDSLAGAAAAGVGALLAARWHATIQRARQAAAVAAAAALSGRQSVQPAAAGNRSAAGQPGAPRRVHRERMHWLPCME